MMTRTCLMFASLLSALVLPEGTSAQSAAQSAEIKEHLAQKTKGRQGCSQARKAIRAIKEDYPGYTFVFAGRKDRTITGIRGCGYAWNTNPAKAAQVAMENCRKWEKEYGTGADGTKTCRILR